MSNLENEYDSILGAETIYNFALKIEEAFIEYKNNHEIKDIEDFNKKLERVKELQSTGFEMSEEKYSEAFAELIELNMSLDD